MPHHFARLRIMELFRHFDRDDKERWACYCKIIAGMTNLRDLYMRLSDTSKTYEDIREHHRRDDLPHFLREIIPSPRYTAPISEMFILDSLYQIKQVRKFTVRFDEREKGQAKPEVRSDSPFTLICEYAEEREEREARLEKRRQEERERWSIKQQEEQSNDSTITNPFRDGDDCQLKQLDDSTITNPFLDGDDCQLEQGRMP